MKKENLLTAQAEMAGQRNSIWESNIGFDGKQTMQKEEEVRNNLTLTVIWKYHRLLANETCFPGILRPDNAEKNKNQTQFSNST